MWKLGDVLDLSCWQEGGLCGDEAVEKQLRASARHGFGDVGRDRTGAGAHRPLPFAKLAGGIAKSSCSGRSTAVTLSLRLT